MWAYIKDNAVVSTFEELPNGWMNVSGLHLLSDEERAALGVHLVQDKRPALATPFHTYQNDQVVLGQSGAPERRADAVLPSLESMRATVSDQIDALREHKIDTGTIEYDGHTYQANRTSMTNLTGAVAVFSAGIAIPTGFTWRTADNQNVTMTLPQLVELAGAMATFIYGTYGVSWALKTAVSTAAHPETFDITQGWLS